MTDEILYLVPNKENFRLTLRAIKLWAKRECIQMFWFHLSVYLTNRCSSFGVTPKSINGLHLRLQVVGSTPTCWGSWVECRGPCWWPGPASSTPTPWPPRWSTSSSWCFPSGECVAFHLMAVFHSPVQSSVCFEYLHTLLFSFAS